ncbi:MAG: helix-turn-helix transcriptional regulator [Lachnospiraceae bacterium]|nr:helix-turn-helix transcriptional regulator [Lachnospiraceae bacterium]
MTLGDIIKEYRNSNNLSMDAFSERSGISKAYISLLEKNKHPQTGKPIAPSIQCIKQAAEGMGMDFNVLFSKIDGNVSLNDTPTDNPLTKKDERDIKKDLDSIMEKIETGEDSPLYYNGEEVDKESMELLRDAIGMSLRHLKIINKEKYNPHKNKK